MERPSYMSRECPGDEHPKRAEHNRNDLERAYREELVQAYRNLDLARAYVKALKQWRAKQNEPQAAAIIHAEQAKRDPQGPTEKRSEKPKPGDNIVDADFEYHRGDGAHGGFIVALAFVAAIIAILVLR